MLNFEKKVYEGTVTYEAQTSAKLISISPTELENSNGTKYRLAQVEMENAKGEVITRNAMIYDANYNHPEAEWKAGQSYLTTVTITEGRKDALVKLSHLTQAVRATADDFGLNISSLSFTEGQEAANKDMAAEGEDVLTEETAGVTSETEATELV